MANERTVYLSRAEYATQVATARALVRTGEPFALAAIAGRLVRPRVLKVEEYFDVYNDRTRIEFSDRSVLYLICMKGR